MIQDWSDWFKAWLNTVLKFFCFVFNPQCIKGMTVKYLETKATEKRKSLLHFITNAYSNKHKHIKYAITWTESPESGLCSFYD